MVGYLHEKKHIKVTVHFAVFTVGPSNRKTNETMLVFDLYLSGSHMKTYIM